MQRVAKATEGGLRVAISSHFAEISRAFDLPVAMSVSPVPFFRACAIPMKSLS